MARRKKKFNFNKLLIGAVLIVGTWFAADYYFNTWLPSRKTAPKPVVVETAAPKNSPSESKGEQTTITEGQTSQPDEPQYQLGAYKNDHYGFELQYPFLAGDKTCLMTGVREDGFDVGTFSFSVVDPQGKLLPNFIKDDLGGIPVDSQSTVEFGSILGTKIDYSMGMSGYGSTTYVMHNNKIYEFGLTASGTESTICGGDGYKYEDRVYQSVITTLKFTK